MSEEIWKHWLEASLPDFPPALGPVNFLDDVRDDEMWDYLSDDEEGLD